MRRLALKSAAVAAALTCAASLVTFAPARADSNDDLTALQNLTDNSDSQATAVLDNVASLTPNAGESNVIEGSAGVGQVSVPTDPADPISVSLPGSTAGMTIGLPFAAAADDAEPLQEGVVSYDNGNGSSTVPVVKSDGSLQITTIIDGADSPSRYTYSVAGEGGATPELAAEGSVVLRSAGGSVVGGFLPPWARDANGAALPTHFEVNGNTVTQVVDHSATDIAYPVVADPAVSYVLLAGEWKNRPGGYKYKNGDQWSTHLSPWGSFVWTQGILGNAAIRVQAWQEWVNGPAPTTTTIHQQFDCHVTFGYAVWLAGLWWDFETARPSHPNWLTDPDKCNWTN